MATPPDSPLEEVVYELEPTRVPKPIPVALEDLCRQTKFTRQEIRVMYRGFKTVSKIFLLIFYNSFLYLRESQIHSKQHNARGIFETNNVVWNNEYMYNSNDFGRYFLTTIVWYSNQISQILNYSTYLKNKL